MKLAELAAYAEKKYQISEQHKWVDFPHFSVLSVPLTGKWAALLMRQKDPVSGKETERCDIKCGQDVPELQKKPWLSAPFRMRGSKWVGVTFDDRTEPAVVFALFDKAVASGGQQGFTIVLEPQPVKDESVYQDIPLPFAGTRTIEEDENIPEKIRQMRAMYDYSNPSFRQKCINFYRQGMFMKDYEDDCPWSGTFFHYFPTYHDLNVKQLRGYFTWRKNVRNGKFNAISTSAAYIYIYELLNGIGANSPAESLEKLKALENGFLVSGIGDEKMRVNLHRWMFEFAVLNGLPSETVQNYAAPEQQKKDDAMSCLRDPDRCSEEELFRALCLFGGNLAESPVIVQQGERGRHLFCESWKTALSEWKREGSDFFVSCFGEQNAFPWYPLANAVFLQQTPEKTTEYVLNTCRKYCCRGGVWQVVSYENLYFNKVQFRAFCHVTDLKLRRYLKTGRYLKEKPEEEWAESYVGKVIETEKKEITEAARPKIRIDFSGLERIREDSLLTRDSLLTIEEVQEMETENQYEETPTDTKETISSDLPLDALQLQILRKLLLDDSAEELLRENHIMPSIAADSINEALFDEFGDTVLTCDDDRLSIVEDYREDIIQFLEENK